MRYNFKFLIRSLKRKPIVAFITIGGYAMSMAVFLVLFTFVVGEKRMNSDFANGKNIYRIQRSDNKSFVPNTLLSDIREKIAGVDKMCLYGKYRSIYEFENEKSMVNLMGTNDDFLDMFSFHFIHKAAEPTLAVKSNIILTSQFSQKLYGKENPVGEVLLIRGKSYNIVGVVNDCPKKASFEFDALVNVDLGIRLRMGYHEEQHELQNAFIMLEDKASAEEVEKSLSGMILHWKAFKDLRLTLCPLKKVYFKGLPNDDLKHANVNLLYLLSSIALLILFMTIFNYVNLSISGSFERLKEMGIKRTNGANKSNIIRQILSESVLVNMMALILAVFVAYAINPLFSDILGKDALLEELFSSPLLLVGAGLLFLLAGIISGIFPAMVFAGISPLHLLIKQKSKKKYRSRNSIVVFQFFITIALIVSVLGIQKQMGFVLNKDLGFNQEAIVKIDLLGSASQKSNVLKEELLKYPFIQSVSASAGNPMMSIPGSASNHFDVNGEKKQIDIQSMTGDEDFVKTFGMSIIHGRDFMELDSSACLINEHLYKELEWDNLEGNMLMGRKVVGVIGNFHYKNLYTEIGNLSIDKESQGWSLNVKIDGNIAEAMESIKNVYATVEPEMTLSYEFYESWIEHLYQREEKQAKAIKVFTLLAILISCLGLIGMVENITKSKIKEIGIRKVNGAKVSEILAMLNKDFIKWVVIAFVIACPIAYFAMNKWLENFAYKTTLSWWIFALAGVLALGIALLTVSWQSWRAATRNPVEALRYE